MLSKRVKIAILAVSTVLLISVLGRIFDVTPLISIWRIWQTYAIIFLYLFWRLVKAVEKNRIGG